MKTMVMGCPAERTLNALGGRWKIFIVVSLFAGTMRYSDLMRRINNGGARMVTHKMLTQDLRQLEASGLVQRVVYDEVPPKVEYSLTPLGLTLRPVVEAMIAWGGEFGVELLGAPCDTGVRIGVTSVVE
ncbi:MAG: helix-turn-helix domain-containing protein [Capsulimonas sp.]|uniref:winged helix-turn-helix transcriptional regulator n=1 Tax=Capsulimonas sp. TaxID=2494211 RepID=UPI003266918B